MNTTELTRRRCPKKTKETLHVETRKAVKSLIITLSLMIVALGATFLITTSEGAQKGYVLEQQKQKNEFLKSESSSLKTKITQATAFSNIEDNETVKDMEEKDEKNYVTKEDISVY